MMKVYLAVGLLALFALLGLSASISYEDGYSAGIEHSKTTTYAEAQAQTMLALSVIDAVKVLVVEYQDELEKCEARARHCGCGAI